VGTRRNGLAATRVPRAARAPQAPQVRMVRKPAAWGGVVRRALAFVEVLPPYSMTSINSHHHDQSPSHCSRGVNVGD
jgi:hypothetical protein